MDDEQKVDRSALRWAAQLATNMDTVCERFGVEDGWRLPVGQRDQAAAELRNVMIEDDGLPWDHRKAVLSGMQLCLTLISQETGLIFMTPAAWRSLAVTADILAEGLE